MDKNLNILIIILLFFTNCSKDYNPLSIQNNSNFSIYLLKDSNITFQEAEKSKLNDLILNDVPWLSINQISMYDFSTHNIYLKTSKDDLFEGMMNNNHIFKDFLVKPFVLIAGNQRIYLGSFISSLSSIAFAGPHINDLDQIFYPSDVLVLNGCGYDERIDVRNDNRIRDALIIGNVYHAGLDVNLSEVGVIDNADTATVKYSFIITNNDKDDLFIPDPDLMGIELFHYYTNGIDFHSSDRDYYYSQYKKTVSPVPINSWRKDWFVRLNSGKSIERTVVLKGYPKFPQGTYDCSFIFSGPRKIDFNDRIEQDGRYWIGAVKSNTISFIL